MRCLALLLLYALPASAESLCVPSGQAVELLEAFWDDADTHPQTLRLRFLAPEIGATRSFEGVEADLLHLCQSEALPRLTADRSDVLIVINLLDRPVPFGASDPAATQYFEAFRAEGEECVWQGL